MSRTPQAKRHDSQSSTSSSECDDAYELQRLMKPSIKPQLNSGDSRRTFELVIFLSAFVVVVITGGTASLLVGWLSALHDPIEGGGSFFSALKNGTFAIKEPSRPDSLHSVATNTETLRILMFSALASHVVSVAGTILVTLFAYRTASLWLRASEDPDSANLTPIQYGLLLRTLGSGSLMAIINALRYTKRSKRAKLPRFFKEAIVGVTVVYTLNHVVGLIDLWLHKTARSISLVRPTPIKVTSAPYGVVFSEDACGPLDHDQLPCQKLITPDLSGYLNWGYSAHS